VPHAPATGAFEEAGRIVRTGRDLAPCAIELAEIGLIDLDGFAFTVAMIAAMTPSTTRAVNTVICLKSV
jgi:hypothetical protein